MLAIGTILPSCLRPRFGRRGGRARVRRIGRPDRARVIALLLGWTLATGAHWDVLQVAAWARMWVSYARVQPLAAAFDTTFSPDAMCGACRTIQAARHDRGGDVTIDLHATEKPLLLLPSLRAIAAESPKRISFARPDDSPPPPNWHAAPPVPPPRLAASIAA